MPMWADRRLLDLFGIEHPILQAPMAAAMDAELAIAVAKAGGLGALPAGMLNAEKLRAQVTQFRTATANKPVNLNFFAHKLPVPNNAREHAWQEKLKPYYLNSVSIRRRRSLQQTEPLSTRKCALSSRSSSPMW